MKKSLFCLNVLNSKDNSFSKLKLSVYHIKDPCTFKELQKAFQKTDSNFYFSGNLLYVADDSEAILKALQSAGYTAKRQDDPVRFQDIYGNSTDRNILYAILKKSFANLFRSRGFELSRKHKKRGQKVALPVANVHKGILLRTGDTPQTQYVVKEGFEYFFSILEDGTVSLRINPRPVITIPSKGLDGSRYVFTPECTRHSCDNFDSCQIHKLGPVCIPKEACDTAQSICLKESNSLRMYCYKTKKQVAIPPDMLFAEASSHNLRKLNIYSKEFYTLNKKPSEDMKAIKQIISALSTGDALTIPISKDITLEFPSEFTRFEVEPWT